EAPPDTPGAWLSPRISDRLWSVAGPRAALDLGTRIEARTFGHFTYLLAAVPRVDALLRCLEAYYGLLSHASRFAIERSGARTCIVVTLLEASRRPAASEVFLVASVTSFLL